VVKKIAALIMLKIEKIVAADFNYYYYYYRFTAPWTLFGTTWVKPGR